MKYHLTEDDYDYLYPYFSPREIKDEWGDMSCSPRWIQETYKRKGYLPWNTAIRELLKRTTDIADIDLPEEEWMEYVYENLSEIRDKRKKKVWERASLFEELF